MKRALGVARAAIAASLLCASSRAVADDKSDVEALLDQPVITTASKSLETGATAPATSSTLTATDMQRLGIHSLAEAIDFLSVGMASESPLSSAQVGARGVLIPYDRGDHVLLLVDGHAVNEPLFGSASFDRGAGIPFELIDHVEVIVGPGSVLYGSNAMLGVINVITKRAEHFEGAHVVVESEIGTSYRAAAGAGHAFRLLNTQAEVTFEIEYYRQDGPAFQFGPQYFGTDVAEQPWRFTRTGAATGTWGGLADKSYYSEIPSGVARLVVGDWQLEVGASIDKRASPYEAIYETEKDFDDPDSWERNRRLGIDVKYGKQVTQVIDLSARLYGDFHDYLLHDDTSSLNSCFHDNVATCRYSVAGLSRTGGLELQSTFDWLRTGEFVTLVGLDARFLQVAAKSDVQDYDTGQYLAPSYGVIDETDEMLGAYAQQSWLPLKELSLNGGARVDVDRRFAPVPSPRLAANVSPWHDATLKAIYSQAFRAPSFYETDYSSPTQIASNSLRPEIVRGVEGMFEQRAGSNRFFVGVFGSWLRDMIYLHVLNADEVNAAKQSGAIGLDASRVVQLQNLSSIDDAGFDAGFDGVIHERLRYGASVTGAMARLEADSGQEPLPAAPELFGNAHVSFDLGEKLPTLGVAAHFLGARPPDRTIEGSGAPSTYASALGEIRATVSGNAPFLSSLGYRVSANYATTPRGAYVVNPLLVAGPGGPTATPPAELDPIDRFRVTVGLSYTLGGEASHAH